MVSRSGRVRTSKGKLLGVQCRSRFYDYMVVHPGPYVQESLSQPTTVCNLYICQNG